MKHNLAFDFTVDKQNNSIKIRREFAADLSTVWDAFTKSEILDKWWAPKPWKSKTKTMDFREGGQWHYAMIGPQGEEHWAIANYQDIDNHKSFTVNDAFADSDGNINKDLPQSKWEVNFSSMGDKTLVDYQITFPDLAQLEETIKMGFKEGMTSAMEGLDALLAERK